MNGVHGHSRGSSKGLYTLATILFDGGGDSGDDAGSPDPLLRIEVALVIRVFPCLNFLQDRIDGCLL